MDRSVSLTAQDEFGLFLAWQITRVKGIRCSGGGRVQGRSGSRQDQGSRKHRVHNPDEQGQGSALLMMFGEQMKHSGMI
jgi:hypothetical protein